MFSMNPRELRRAMKRMGINVEELKGVKSVIIVLEDKEIILQKPQIMVMKVQGQKIYQIAATKEEIAEVKEEKIEEVKFSEEDIAFVMEQAGVSRDKAIEALNKSGGDIAEAILLLTSEK